MGIYFRAPSLEPGERVDFEATSKRVWTGRSVAGKLVVTDRRVLYMPTWVDTLVGGRPWAAQADDIKDVQIEAGGSAGVRKRGPAGWHETTRIDVGGSSAYFAVRDGDQLRAALSRLRT
jgi:hypothetical protein